MELAPKSKKKKAARGKETLFRSAYHNQSSLIQMADNKANIIISINTMIISTIIAISGYGAVAGKLENYEIQVLVPIFFIIISCLISAIFAIQAARPKLINNRKVGNEIQKSSLLFFGVIAEHTQTDYINEMKKLLDSGEEIYEQMTLDLYNQGLVLKRKYNLLVYAYQIFMFGFIFSVLVFLGFILFGNI